MVLHANELGPSVLLCNKLHLCKLHCPHGARSNVPDLSALYQVMQRLHRFFYGCILVEAMDLQQIDVVSVQALKRFVNRIENGSTTQSTLIGVVFDLRQLLGVHHSP